MSDTPRSDAAEYDLADMNDGCCISGPSGLVSADFARDLELELKVALSEIATLKAMVAK